MRRELRSDLPRLGRREYVQGGTIFNGILDAFDQAFGSRWLEGARVTSFKLERESFGNGRIVVADESMSGEDANAVLAARNAAGSLFATYTDDGREAPHMPYDEESYYRVLDVREDFGGEFALPASRSRADFIRGVIGANKLVHQRATRFPKELLHIQFLYLKDLDLQCIVPDGEECRLSIVNLMVQEREGHVWTISRVGVTTNQLSSQFRLCYRGQKPDA